MTPEDWSSEIVCTGSLRFFTSQNLIWRCDLRGAVHKLCKYQIHLQQY